MRPSGNDASVEPSSSNDPRVIVPGSERALPLGRTPVSEPDFAQTAEVTIIVRARASSAPAAAALAQTPPQERTYLDRAQFAAQYGAEPADMDAVTAFATQAGLTIVSADAARRSVVVSGTVGALATAFGATLHRCDMDGATYRMRSGTLTVPQTLDGIVVGVFGLDNRPQARAHVRPAAAAVSGYTPLQVATAYNFPPAQNGTGQTIALIELGGGYVQADLATYFSGLGLTTPTVVTVGVDGATNAPAGDPNSADGEVMLDLEVAGAIAPGATLVVYFAPNTDQGFLDAITTAIHDATNKPTILSISWGGPESSYTQQALTNFDAAFSDAGVLGISVLIAAGDGGSSDGLTDGLAHVDFPASSPHVTACGGTSLQLSGTGIASETVWNDGSSGGATGGGVSDVFALPAYQAGANVPPSANPGAHVGRGVPDVAGDADPQTGYAIRVDGTDGVFGGTSAVAPLVAAFVARANQQLGKPLGFLNSSLYPNGAAFHDITSGNNGAYTATTGWDACTGLGTLDGAKLVTALGAYVASPRNAARSDYYAILRGPLRAVRLERRAVTTRHLHVGLSDGGQDERIRLRDFTQIVVAT